MFRLMALFHIHPLIGPKIFTLQRMTIDLVFFLFLLMVNTKLYTNHDPPPYRTYHANRLLSAMCFSFYCFRFVQLFEINDQIGPKVFMLKKMAIDLFFFLFLLLVNLRVKFVVFES